MYFGRHGSEATHRLTRARVHWICGQVTGRRVLEVGCSQGIVALLLAREGFDVLAIDVHAPSIAYARRMLSEEEEPVRQRLTYRTTVGDFSDIDGTFDTAILGEVVEHLVQPKRIIEELLPFLNVGGRLVLTTPLGVHLAPDHKEPLYPSQLRDMLAPHFRLDGWQRFADHEADVQYLGLNCLLDPDAAEPHASYAAAVQTLAEEGLLSTQMKLAALRSRQRERQSTIDTLRKEVETLRAARDTMKGELVSLQRELSVAKTAYEQLEQDYVHQKATHQRDREALRRLSARRVVRLADAIGRRIDSLRTPRRG